MTPAEHYAHAEELLAETRKVWERDVEPVIKGKPGFDAVQLNAVVAAFHVRATSALAHATLALYREEYVPS